MFSRGKKIGAIRFFGGGEPTLEMGTIKKIVGFAREKYGIGCFEIQSNLLFGKSDAEFIADNFSKIICSVDGPPEIQKMQRGVTPAQSRIIEKNLGFFLSKKIDTMVKCTVSKYSNQMLEEIAEYFAKIGAKKVMMDIICQKGKALVPESDFNTPPGLESFLKNFSKAKKLAEKKGLFVFSWFLPVEFSGIHFCQNQLFCDPCLTTDGYISVCDEHFLGKGNKSPFIIGKVDWEKNKINLFRKKTEALKKRTVPNMPKCSECFLKWSCRGQCPSRCLDLQGDFHKPNEEECRLMKRYSREFLLWKAGQALKHA